MNHDDIVLFGERHDLFEKLKSTTAVVGLCGKLITGYGAVARSGGRHAEDRQKNRYLAAIPSRAPHPPQ